MTNQQSSSVWVIIPAAGTGQRMLSDIPKQYLKTQNKMLIEHTLACFQEHEDIEGIVVVLSSDDEYWQSSLIESLSKPVFTVEGGKDRSDSVIQGLKYLVEEKNIPLTTWIMVHDAARPCLSITDIDSLLSIRDDACVGGILASPVRDTMKRASLEKDSVAVKNTESRENLWHALTPQLFRLGQLKEAINTCQDQGIVITDECSAMESNGFNPLIVEGSPNNIKVTYPSDLELVSFLISKESHT